MALNKRDKAELARARAKRRGKVAVFEGGPDQTISEKSPSEIQAQRNIDIKEAEKKIEKEKLRERGLLPKTETEELPAEKITGEEDKKLTLKGLALGGEGSIEDVAGVDLKQGTVPIGLSPTGLKDIPSLVGKAGKTAKATADVVKGTKKVSAVGKILRKERSIQRIQKQFKIQRKGAEKIADQYEKMDTPALTRLLTKAPKLIKPAVSIGAAIAGADTIFTWYALDNISDGLKFVVPDARKGLQAGVLTPEEARELFSETDLAYDLAMEKVNASARLNPLTWASRKLITAGVRIKRADYEIVKNTFLSEIEGL